MTTDTPARTAINRFRWGAGLVIISPVTLLAVFWASQTGAIISPSSAEVTVFVVLTCAIIAIGATSLIGGYLLLWIGSRPKAVGGWLLRLGVLLSALSLPLLIPIVLAFVTTDPALSGILIGVATFVAFLFALGALVATVAGLSIALAKGGFAGPGFGPASPSARRLATAVAGVLLLVILGLGLYLGLVDDPLAQSPGHSLAWTYPALAKAGELPDAVVPLVVWAVFWAIPIVFLVILGLVPSRPGRLLNRVWRPRTIGTVALVVGGPAMTSQWFAEFGMGLDLGDDVPPFVGGNSLFGAIYGLLALIVLATAVVRTVAPPLRWSRPLGGWSTLRGSSALSGASEAETPTPELGRDGFISI
jgi:hypothetical protein